jgi:hypothetical protein
MTAYNTVHAYMHLSDANGSAGHLGQSPSEVETEWRSVAMEHLQLRRQLASKQLELQKAMEGVLLEVAHTPEAEFESTA